MTCAFRVSRQLLRGTRQSTYTSALSALDIVIRASVNVLWANFQSRVASTRGVLYTDVLVVAVRVDVEFRVALSLEKLTHDAVRAIEVVHSVR